MILIFGLLSGKPETFLDWGALTVAGALVAGVAAATARWSWQRATNEIHKRKAANTVRGKQREGRQVAQKVQLEDKFATNVKKQELAVDLVALHSEGKIKVVRLEPISSFPSGRIVHFSNGSRLNYFEDVQSYKRFVQRFPGEARKTFRKPVPPLGSVFSD